MLTPGLLEIIQAGAPPHQVGEDGPFEPVTPAGGPSELESRVALWLGAATGGRPKQVPFVLTAVGGLDRLRASLCDARLRPDRSLPSWVSALDDFLQCLPGGFDELLDMEPPGAVEVDEWRPDSAQDPLALVWNGALWAALQLVPDSGLHTVTLSHAARTDLGVSLVGRILAVITRALDPELLAARALGFTSGEALGGDRDSWLDRLRDMPGLAYPLGTAVAHWRASAAQFLKRLDGDLEMIAAEPLMGPVSGRIARLAPDAGDPHEGGQSVCIVRFDTGARVVYKPKPQEGPAAWQKLLAALAASPQLRAGGVELATRTIIARDGYGWDQLVPVQETPVADEAEVARWLASYGALCRVLEIVESADMWFDNLITSGGLPQFIDVETVLQPKPTALSFAERLLAETSAPTGAVSMALPLPDGEVEDIGGLRPVGRVRLPFTERVMGQLSSRVDGYDETGMMVWTPPRWRPDIPPGMDPLEPLIGGYRSVDAALGEPDTQEAVLHALDALARAPSRVVLRSTFVCYVLLRESLRPEVLTSGWRRDIALASLLSPAAAVVAEENGRDAYGEQLLRVGASDMSVFRDLDIPLVRHDPTGESIRLDDGGWISDWFEGVPLERAHERVVHRGYSQMRERVLRGIAAAALATGTPHASAARETARRELVAALVDEGADEREALSAVAATRA